MISYERGYDYRSKIEKNRMFASREAAEAFDTARAAIDQCTRLSIEDFLFLAEKIKSAQSDEFMRKYDADRKDEKMESAP